MSEETKEDRGAEEPEDAENGQESEPPMFQYHFVGPIREETFAAFSHFLRQASVHLPEEGKIEIFITSPGGSFNYCLAAYDMIRQMSQEVTTIIAGNADSCATILFLAGDRRLILPNATAGFHEPSWTPDAETGLNTSESAKMAKDLQYTFDKILSIICERTRIKRPHIKRLCEEVTSLSAKELLKYGFAHKIIKPKKP